MINNRLNVIANLYVSCYVFLTLSILPGDFSDLLREIMAEVRRLTNAERCSLFLLDPDQQDLVAKVFDGISTKEVSSACASHDQFHKVL